MMIVLVPSESHKVFDTVYDLNKVLEQVFGNGRGSDSIERVSTSIVGPYKYASLDTVMRVEELNPVFYGKKTKIRKMHAIIRGDVRVNNFPFNIYPERYVGVNEFLEAIPSKFTSLTTSITAGERVSLGDLLSDIISIAATHDQKVFGTYREEKCFGENSQYQDNLHKVINIFICEEKPTYQTNAGVAIDIAIVEGK